MHLLSNTDPLTLCCLCLRYDDDVGSSQLYRHPCFVVSCPIASCSSEEEAGPGRAGRQSFESRARKRKRNRKSSLGEKGACTKS